MRNKFWLSVIIGGWITVAAYSQALEIQRDLTPATSWLRVSRLHVYDAWEGEPPFMDVDRTIVHPFVGEWQSTVRIVSDGTNSFACLAEGKAAYSTDARLPPNLTLDWWTYPAKCRPPPGRYRLDTTWTIKPPGYPVKELTQRSNVFEIHALPDAIRRLRPSP